MLEIFQLTLRPNYFRVKTALPTDVDTAFRWHEQSKAFERLLPTWEDIEILSDEGITNGSRVALNIKLGPFNRYWRIRRLNYFESRQFSEHMEKGSFKHWRYRHVFRKGDDVTSVMKDSIDYMLPFGSTGFILGKKYVTNRLKSIFRYRHEVLKRDLEFYSDKRREKPLNILIAGGTGFIGKALIPFLASQGNKITVLSRQPELSSRHWQPSKGVIDIKPNDKFDVVINLAGENIQKNWTSISSDKIKSSRLQSITLLRETLLKLETPPEIIINASSAGYYGHLNGMAEEANPCGDTNYAKMCNELEEAWDPIQSATTRVIHLRMGAVLSPKGGLLKKLVPLFKYGLGTRLEKGKQPFSWVSINDLIWSIGHCLLEKDISGPVNCASAEPTTIGEFSDIYAQHAKHSAVFKCPTPLLRCTLNKTTKEMFFQGTHAHPKKLLGSGFYFSTPDLPSALDHVLGKFY